MSWLVKGAAGVTRLSELEIDADKDWQAKAITNLQAIAADMAHGDVVFRGSSVMERLAAGEPGQFLRTMGPANDPVWADAPVVPERFIELPVLEVSVPGIGAGAAEDHSGGGHTSEETLAMPVPAVSDDVRAAAPNAAGGAVAHNEDGVPQQTDETAAANNAVANDMTLLPADCGAPNDAYCFGYDGKFDVVCLNIGQVWQGTSITLAYEYSRGAGAWGTLANVKDGTDRFRSPGKGWINFDRPSDWATDTVGGIANRYWIRMRVASISNGTQQPLGTQAWIGAYA